MGPDEAELLRLAERPAAERNRLSLRDEPQGSRTSEPRSVIFIDDIALVDLVNDVERELANAERELYDGTRRKAIEDFASGTGEKQRFAILAALTRLRQLACDPALVHEGTQIRSSKLAALVELLSDIEERGGRALIFSQFTSLLARVRLEFDRRGLRYLELDGSTPAAQRVNLVDRWQAGEGLAFLISLKAGGTGLNLTSANHVVLYDRWWNPAVEDQARDRAWRIGQTKTVVAHRLVCPGTVDERVEEVVQGKRRIADMALPKSSSVGDLDSTQLQKVLGIDEDTLITEDDLEETTPEKVSA